MPRVLILTASYGSGHNEAARCLATALAAQGAEPIVLDHFRACAHPLFDRLSRALYVALLRRAPAIWGLAYELGDRMASDSWMTFGASRVGAAWMVKRVLQDGWALDKAKAEAEAIGLASPQLAAFATDYINSHKR